MTAAQISTDLNAHHARLTQLKVEDPVAGTFSVVMVANSGPYASGWWWYFGVIASQVATLLSTNDARLISIDPYEESGTLYFAVVEVPENGVPGPRLGVVLRPDCCQRRERRERGQLAPLHRHPPGAFHVAVPDFPEQNAGALRRGGT